MSSPTLSLATDAPIAVARNTYQASVDKNRPAIERLIADDFTSAAHSIIASIELLRALLADH
jgi:hypothetical protein